ncbi:MAG TPA: galactose-1-phosphate uridylyltransferase [Polyangiaceae bacterium]|nr:galactose-1-phosphate uridylyltransferase [Polyangiaceae bacterium]
MTWEERWHPLRREWVIVAAHRQNRPWSGGTVGPRAERRPSYVADCYLCPGNERVSGAHNPAYRDVFVFDNDHPAVSELAPREPEPRPSFYRAQPARGVARVVCYTPRHDASLAELEPAGLMALLREWQRQYVELGRRPEVAHVLVFENRGEVVGVSNPHPHCQIYATNFVFPTIRTEVEASLEHRAETGRNLFQDIISAELEDGRRVITQNDGALAFVPYFARYAYETYVAPRRSYPSIADVPPAELAQFAEVLRDVLVRFDNLWQMPFPYVMTLHQAPTDGGDYQSYHFHVQFQPPLRKPNLLKYLAGPEIGGGGFLSDTSPENKAEDLRSASGPHYRSVTP